MSRSKYLLPCLLLGACAGPTQDTTAVQEEPREVADLAAADPVAQTPVRPIEGATLPPTEARSGQGELSMGEAVRLALSMSPEMEVARAQVLLAGESESVAGTWADPILIAGVEGLPFSSPRDEEEYLVGIAFALPAPGEMGAESDVARAESDVARAAWKRTMLETDQRVREAFGSALAAEHAAGLAAELAELHQQRYAVAEAEWQAGAATEESVLDPQFAAVRAQSDRAAADRAAKTARALLNQLLPAEAHHRPLVGDLDIALALPELDAMLTRMETIPGVEEARAEVRLAHLRAQLADARRIPEVGIDLNWRRLGDGRSAMDAVVGVGLPFGGRRAAEARGSQHMAAASAALARARWREIGSELTQAHAAASTAREQLHWIEEELLPLRLRAEELVRARYEQGGTSRGGWIDAQVAVLEMQFEALQARADYQAAWVVLRPYLLAEG